MITEMEEDRRAESDFNAKLGTRQLVKAAPGNQATEENNQQGDGDEDSDMDLGTPEPEHPRQLPNPETPSRHVDTLRGNQEGPFPVSNENNTVLQGLHLGTLSVPLTVDGKPTHRLHLWGSRTPLVRQQ